MAGVCFYTPSPFGDSQSRCWGTDLIWVERGLFMDR